MLRYDLAQGLRERSTDVERLLWKLLRNRQLENYKFRRQQPIGRYIVDFVCQEQRLIIELDGGQHAERIEQDQRRDRRCARYRDHACNVRIKIADPKAGARFSPRIGRL